MPETEVLDDGQRECHSRPNAVVDPGDADTFPYGACPAGTECPPLPAHKAAGRRRCIYNSTHAQRWPARSNRITHTSDNMHPYRLCAGHDQAGVLRFHSLRGSDNVMNS